jgi:aspartate aminotransferase
MGIHTSKQLCSRILDDTGVAMLPGSDFGRDPGEFSARIAYVDFDGRAALEASELLFNEERKYDEFVETYCPKVVAAINRLGNWLA